MGEVNGNTFDDIEAGEGDVECVFDAEEVGADGIGGACERSFSSCLEFWY